MFFIDVTGPTGMRTVVLPSADLTIGSGPDNDIQIEHPDIAAQHVTVIERAKRAVVLGNDTTVNGLLIDEPTVLTDSCLVGVGPFRLKFRYVDLPPDTVEAVTEKVPMPSSEVLTPVEIVLDLPPMSNAPTPQMPFPVVMAETPISSLLRASENPEELGFLRVIAGESFAKQTRTAYADWLEARGDLERADYLRGVSDAPDASVAALGTHIALPWRAAVALPSLPIENCSRKGCPETWGQVGRGSIDDPRRCGVCVRYVRYATDIHHARLLAAGDRPVVIDPCVPRKPRDLEDLPPRSKCKIG